MEERVEAAVDKVVDDLSSSASCRQGGNVLSHRDSITGTAAPNTCLRALFVRTASGRLLSLSRPGLSV
eukprot:366528-Chlamydomonas_euryale.AAC.16